MFPSTFRITSRLDASINGYITILGTIAYLMVGIPGIAIFIEGKEIGWLRAFAKGAIYPVYVSCVMSSWAWVSGKLEDSVSG